MLGFFLREGNDGGHEVKYCCLLKGGARVTLNRSSMLGFTYMTMTADARLNDRLMLRLLSIIYLDLL